MSGFNGSARIAERRKYPRAANSGCLVFYKPINKDDAIVQESFTCDISMEGMNIATLELFAPGGILACEVYLPLNKERDLIVPLLIATQVVWISELENTRKDGSSNYKMGVKFTNVSPHARERITEYITGVLNNTLPLCAS